MRSIRALALAVVISAALLVFSQPTPVGTSCPRGHAESVAVQDQPIEFLFAPASQWREIELQMALDGQLARRPASKSPSR